MLEHAPIRKDLVTKRCPNLIIDQLLMTIIAEARRKFRTGHEPVEIVIAKVELNIVTPHTQRAELGLRIVKVERDTVVVLIVIKVGVEKSLAGIVTAAGIARGRAGKCILNGAEVAACFIVTGSLTCGVGP